MRDLRLIAAVILFSIFSVLPVFGQAVTATVLGGVTDTSGAAVVGAKVVITEQNTGTVRNTETNQSGNYTFSNIPAGTYTVEVDMQGFRKAIKQGIDVLVNTSTRADLVLQPGDVKEQIVVTAEAALLQTDRSDTGRKIESKQLESLPLASGNRNFQALMTIVPGATRAFFSHSEFFNSQQSMQSQVNGQSRLANNVQLEGVDNNHRTGLLTVLIPPLEAIQTVDISTSNFEAELGRAGGAVQNVILKSGTNDLHGMAYEYNRVAATSSRNFFDTSRGAYTYNYFGGGVGGRIIRNRTFFFGDYLRVTDHRTNPNRVTVPTDAFRTGDLSAGGTEIYDPATGIADGHNRTPFANRVIPASRISPIAQKILALTAKQNLSGISNNYSQGTAFRRDTDSFDVKIDHNQSSNDRITGRYSFQRPVVYDAPFTIAGGPHGGGFAGTGVNKTQSGAVNYDHLFSPTFITQFRAGVSRYRNVADNADAGTNAADAIGIKGVNVNQFTSGMAGIDISGGFSNPIVGYSPSLPWIRTETNINLVNIWTKTVSNHTVKWGVELRRLRDDLLQTQTYSPRGLYRFREGQTQLNCQGVSGACDNRTSLGNSFASFLLDVPNETGRDLPIIFPAYRAWQFFTFVQDKWQVTPKLTFDIGLRWEYYPPATPAHNGGFSNYDPTTNSLIIAGVGGNPSNLGLRANKKDFAPRLGAAYRMTDKTVFRAGFGVSYSPFPDNTYAYNFPVKQNNSYLGAIATYGVATLPDGRPASMANGFPAATPAVIPTNGIITNADKAQSYDIINLNFREPHIISWNLAVQRSLPKNFVFEAAYVGNHGVSQPTVYNVNAVNQAADIGTGNAGRPLFKAFNKASDANLRFVGSDSHYNSLQVKMDRRFAGGFAMTTAYTFGKAMGFQPEDGGFSYYINPRRGYSRLDFDRTHTFVQTYSYQLPFGKGKTFATDGVAAMLLGGWQVNGILDLRTGTPLNFGVEGSTLNTPGNSQSGNIDGPVKILHGIDNALWLDTANFSRPAPGVFGNIGKNIIGGPGLFNLDASLFRSFYFKERFKLDFRAEGFSITNTPQFSNPNANVANINFGKVKGTNGGARSMQFGIRLSF